MTGLDKYILGSTIYCAVHKLATMRNTKYATSKYDIDSRTYHRKTSPVLVLDKLTVATLHGIAGRFIFPAVAWSDMRNMEKYVRGIKDDTEEDAYYNINARPNVSIMDYIFCI